MNFGDLNCLLLNSSLYNTMKAPYSERRRRDEGRSRSVFITICSLVSLDQEAPHKINFCTRVVYRVRHLDCNLSSSIARAMAYKRRCISEMELPIGLKFGAKLVLLIYIAIAIFAKNHTWQVFL